MTNDLRIRLAQAKTDRSKLDAEVERLEKEFRGPKYVWKHGDIATTRKGGQKLFINIGGKLRIYEEVSQIRTSSANIQYWAECFGYKKIGNVFEL